MVVELRDKLDVLALTSGLHRPSSPGVLPRAERFQDAIAALVRLGYSGAQAQDAVRKVAEDGEPSRSRTWCGARSPGGQGDGRDALGRAGEGDHEGRSQAVRHEQVCA